MKKDGSMDEDGWIERFSADAVDAFEEKMVKEKKKKGYADFMEGVTVPMSPEKQREVSGYTKDEIAANKPPPAMKMAVAEKPAAKKTTAKKDKGLLGSALPKKIPASKKGGKKVSI